MIQITYGNLAQRGDLVTDTNNSLVDDLDLETAVLISIFSNARMPSDHDDFAGYGPKGGWWGDDHAEEAGDITGSLLWLLRREVATIANINQAKIWLENALQWLLDDGVAESVVVEAWRGDAPVDMRFKIDIKKPGVTEIWSRVWGVQLNAL